MLKRDFSYSDEEVSEIIKIILKFVLLVEPTCKVDIIKEDSEDNKIIECAIESSSEYIIIYDKHLLNLDKYKEIKIIKPEEAMSLFG